MIEDELQKLFVPGLNIITGPTASGKSTIIQRVLKLYSDLGIPVSKELRWQQAVRFLNQSPEEHLVLWVSELNLKDAEVVAQSSRGSPDAILLLEMPSTRSARETGSPVVNSPRLFHEARTVVGLHKKGDTTGVATLRKNTHGPSGLTFEYDLRRIVPKTLWQHLTDDD